jgi:formate dehydrogenase maturation protein FdhE
MSELDYRKHCIPPVSACPACGASIYHAVYDDTETNEWSTTRRVWCELCLADWVELMELHEPFSDDLEDED